MKLLAPNGKPSNLTPEQYKLVRTPAFKSWFGDWENDAENSSKVVDSNGEPLVVYHGTYIKNKKKNGIYTELNTSTYFTDQKLTAEKYPIGDYVFYNSMQELQDDLGGDFVDYINDNFDIDESKGIMFSAEAENVWENFEFENIHIYQCFLDIKKPKIYYQFAENEYEFQDLSKDSPIINQFRNEGYNGLIKIYEGRWFTQDWVALNQGKKSDYEKEKHFVIFSSNQIKLADGTNTTFDGSNPDIRFGGGGKVTLNKNFKKWFDDNLNEFSVNNKGVPTIWYHARSSDFNTFKKNYAYFAETETYASQYGDVVKPFYVKCKKTLNLEFVKYDLAYRFETLVDWIEEQGGKKEGKDYEILKNAYSKYTKANPDKAFFLMWEFFSQYNPFAKHFVGWLKKYFDSIYYWEQGKRSKNNRGWNKGKILYVFGNEIYKRIKLADGSNTKFDSNNRDIRYGGGGGVEETKWGITITDEFSTESYDFGNIGNSIKKNNLEVGQIQYDINKEKGIVWIYLLEVLQKGIGAKVINYFFNNGINIINGDAVDSIEFWKKMGAKFDEFDEDINGYPFTISKEDFVQTKYYENSNTNIRFDGGGSLQDDIRYKDGGDIPEGIKLLPLTMGKFAIVDAEDFDYLNQWKWRTGVDRSRDGKIVNYYGQRTIYIGGKTPNTKATTKQGSRYQQVITLGKQIMGIPEDRKLRVDYIDGNKLNNQKSNLRVATISQINYGATSAIDKKKITSKYIGVSYRFIPENKIYDKRTNSYYIRNATSYWRVVIKDRERKYEKNFPYTDVGEINAAKWYDSIAKLIHGEFAVLNFPEDKYEDGGELTLTSEQVENKLGRKLHWWNDDVVSINGIEYKKVFLKSEYKRLYALGGEVNIENPSTDKYNDIFINGEKVGYIILSPARKEYYWLDINLPNPLAIVDIKILKEFRGKNYMTQTMNWLFNFAKENGHNSLFLRVDDNSEISQETLYQIYSKYGFSTYKTSDDDDDIFMYKLL